MDRDQLIQDRADFDIKNNLINEELRRVQDLIVTFEDLVKLLTPKRFDPTAALAKLDDLRTKLANLLALRNGN